MNVRMIRLISEITLNCVLIFSTLKYLFFLLLPDDPVFLLRRSATTDIKAYKPVAQQEAAAMEPQVEQYKYHVP